MSRSQAWNQMSPSQCLAHIGSSINYSHPSHPVSGGRSGTCRFKLWRFKKKKEPLLRLSQSARWAGGAGLLNGPMAGRALSEPAPASRPPRRWGLSRPRPKGGASWRPHRTAEGGEGRGGAGRARVSVTEPQVAAGAGLGPSSGGKCCSPRHPRNPLARAAPHAHRAWQPGGPGGQRRGGV